MDKFEIIIPCIFGLEALIAKELKWLGYETHKVEDGRVTFMGTFEDVASEMIPLALPGYSVPIPKAYKYKKWNVD